MTGRIFLYFFSFFLSWNKWSVFGLRFQMSMSNWSSSSLLHSEIKINYHVQKISHNLCFDIVVKLKRSQRQNDPSSNTAAGRDAFSSLKLFSDSPRWIIGGQDLGSQIFHLTKGPSQLLKSKYDQSPGKALDKLLVSIVVQWQMSWFCHHQALIYKVFFSAMGKVLL